MCKSSAVLIALTCLHFGIPRVIDAQVITGHVVDSLTGSPLPTGFVVLIDANDREVARTQADANGGFTFRLRQRVAGPFRVRSERIGYRPTMSQPFDLWPEETADITLRVAALPVSLGTIEVGAETECDTHPGERDRTAAVWDEAQKALAAASWTANQRQYRYLNNAFELTLDDRQRSVVQENHHRLSGYYTTPFVSRDPNILAQEGFITSDGEEYFAPDAQVLQHETFLATHCFRVVRDENRDGSVGLSFEPISSRDLPDVAGVLWLNEQNAELQSLEYRYTNHPAGFDDGRVGGTIGFMSLPSGAWIINKWEMRMPMLELRSNPRSRVYQREIALRGFYHAGGEVLSITRGSGEHVYEAEMAEVVGTVRRDSVVGGAPLSGAAVMVVGAWFAAVTSEDGAFVLKAPLNGDYQITFTHPSLDSMGFVVPPRSINLARGRVDSLSLTMPSLETVMTHYCPNRFSGPGHRVLVGTVRDATTETPMSDADVSVTWQSLSIDGGAISAQNRSERFRTGPSGEFSICNMEIGRPALVSASARNARSRPIRIEFAEKSVSVAGEVHQSNSPIWKIDVATSPDQVAPSVYGTVRDARTFEALDQAEVTVGNSLATHTDASGLFTVNGVTEGQYQITIRRVGYEKQSGNVEVRDGRAPAFSRDLLFLTPLPYALDPISVEGVPSRRQLAGFWERRARGAGSFITREEIERQGNPNVPTQVLLRMDGIRVVPNREFASTGVRWVVTMTRGGPRTMSGPSNGCPPLYFVDGHYKGDASEVDIDAILSMNEVEAAEAFGSTAGMPPIYNRRGATCGVIAFWTR